MVKILNFLGCGSAFNPLLGSTSAYFIRGETLVVLDAGESVFKSLFELELLKTCTDIFILITHTHADHVGSLASMISYCYFVLHKKITVMHPNESVLDLLEKQGVCEDIYQYKNQSQITIMDVAITAIAVKHSDSLACFGYRIESPEEVIFYSGDSYEIPTPVMEDFLKGRIVKLFQDTCECVSPHPSHCPLPTLESQIPLQHRNRLYCMHFSSNFTAQITEKGFRFVEVGSGHIEKA